MKKAFSLIELIFVIVIIGIISAIGISMMTSFVTTYIDIQNKENLESCRKRVISKFISGNTTNLINSCLDIHQNIKIEKTMSTQFYACNGSQYQDMSINKKELKWHLI